MESEYPTNNLCTTVDAARYLLVHRLTLISWCKKGLIPGAVKIGRNWKVPRKEIVRIKKEGLVLPE